MVHRGELYFADLSPVVGSEQGGKRPVLIIQNDVGNRFSPTVIIAAVTTKPDKTRQSTHISVEAEKCGLPRDSVILLEQIRTIDKARLISRIGELDEKTLKKVDIALRISLGVTG